MGQTAPGGVSQRRRGTVLEDALLHAAWDEVRAVGYANLTMEGIAARASTNKSVLYRRWPNRASLVRDAMRHCLGPADEHTPDTGNLRADTLSVLRRARDTYREVGADIIYGLMSELPDLPRDTLEVIPGVMTTILTRAAERGEVQPENITPLVATVPWDLLRNKLMTSNAEVTDTYVEEIIDDIFLPLVTRNSTTN